MKKLLIMCMVLLLVGCQSDTDEIMLLKEEINALESTILQLNADKTDIMKQIKDISSEKMKYDEENVALKAELDVLIEEKAALEIDNEALMKSLNTIEFDPYEAQYNFDVKVIQDIDNRLLYVFEPSEIPHAQNYTILGNGPIKNNINEEDESTIDLGDAEFEVTSFKVEGTIYNFKWVTITWDESYNTYEVDEVLIEIDNVTDRRINIHSVLPEGLPFQAVQWENSKGELFSIALSYDGYGFEGTIIVSD
ncbi:MAG: hypothetical protein JEZ08_05490 [Clostridiales bacterium]|nr:hypothetical protein [Clostridiales bacterium]